MVQQVTHMSARTREQLPNCNSTTAPEHTRRCCATAATAPHLERSALMLCTNGTSISQDSMGPSSTCGFPAPTRTLRRPAPVPAPAPAPAPPVPVAPAPTPPRAPPARPALSLAFDPDGRDATALERAVRSRAAAVKTSAGTTRCRESSSSFTRIASQPVHTSQARQAWTKTAFATRQIMVLRKGCV